MKTLSTLILTLLLTSSLEAQSFDPSSAVSPLSGRAYLSGGQIVAPGQDEELIIDLNLREGFFAYEKKFKVTMLEPEDGKLNDHTLSPIVSFKDVVTKKMKTGIKNQATLRNRFLFPKDLPLDFKRVLVDLEYVACTEKFCLLPKTLHLVVPVKVVLPSKSAGTVSETNPKNFADNVGHYVENNFFWALALIFFFGFLTSFTPCVYPLIPITLAVLGANKGRSKAQSFLLSLSYVIGIALTYALLGVVAAQTGQLFGSLLSHPVVIIFMSVLLFAMGLSLFGVFELQAPAFIRNRTQHMGTKGGFLGAFISGTVAGIVASPCVGPVLVGVLAYIAQTQDSSLGFVLLFTFAMGFGLLFVVLGTFSQLSHKLPRSGRWMNTVKSILGSLLIALSFYYAWPLIKKIGPQKTEIKKSHGVSWKKFSQKHLDEAKAAGRPVIIDFYADWCVACVEMDELTFSKTSVIERAKEFTMLKVDATENFEGLNEIKKTYKVFGLPTMIFIDRQGQVSEDLTLTGFEEAELFIKRMDTVLGPGERDYP